MSSTSDITLSIVLDENKVPDDIRWTASDGGVHDQSAKAFILSVWEPKEKQTMRIDLWTKDMPVTDMNIFIHQTLLSLADTIHRATDNHEMSESLKDFSEYFAEKVELKKKS